jgi:hypothetical protein
MLEAPSRPPPALPAPRLPAVKALPGLFGRSDAAFEYMQTFTCPDWVPAELPGQSLGRSPVQRCRADHESAPGALATAGQHASSGGRCAAQLRRRGNRSTRRHGCSIPAPGAWRLLPRGHARPPCCWNLERIDLDSVDLVAKPSFDVIVNSDPSTTSLTNTGPLAFLGCEQSNGAVLGVSRGRAVCPESGALRVTEFRKFTPAPGQPAGRGAATAGRQHALPIAWNQRPPVELPSGVFHRPRSPTTRSRPGRGQAKP